MVERCLAGSQKRGAELCRARQLLFIFSWASVNLSGPRGPSQALRRAARVLPTRLKDGDSDLKLPSPLSIWPLAGGSLAMYGVYCMDYQYPVVQVSKRTVATLKEFWSLLCMLFGQNWSSHAGFVEGHCFQAVLLVSQASAQRLCRGLWSSCTAAVPFDTF